MYPNFISFLLLGDVLMILIILQMVIFDTFMILYLW